MTRALVLAACLALPSAGLAAFRDDAPAPPAPAAAADRAHLEQLARDANLPPAALQSLTGEQVFQLLRAEQNRRSDSTSENVAGVIAAVASFVVIFFIVAASLYAGYRRRLVQHETVRLALERGAPVPPQLLLDAAPSPDADLRRGILLLSLGMGVAILLAALPGAEGAWGIGAVLGLLGLGYLLSWYLIGRRRAAPEPTA